MAEAAVEPTAIHATCFREKRENGQRECAREGNRRNQPEEVEHAQPLISLVASASSIMVLMIEPKHERQADRDFRRRHGQNEEKHDLAVRLAPARACRNESQSRAVQHDLDRHQNKNQITAHQKSGQAQREQDSRQNERVPHRNSCHIDPRFLECRPPQVVSSHQGAQ